MRDKVIHAMLMRDWPSGHLTGGYVASLSATSKPRQGGASHILRTLIAGDGLRRFENERERYPEL